jgi:hypothetical protein
VRQWAHWAFAVVFVVALLLRLPGLERLLGGSEVDYVRAARRGFLTNYFDLGTRPVSMYVAAALAMGGSTGEQREGDPDLWQDDIEANDIAAYRHYHPPLFIYMLNAVERLFGYTEIGLRLVPLFFSLIAVIAVYFGCVLLIPAQGRLIGVVAASILSLMSLHIGASTNISWHITFTGFATIALFMIGYLRIQPRVAVLVWTAVVITLAFAVLEHAIFLYGTLAAMLVLTDNRWLSISRRGITYHRGLVAAAVAAVLTLLIVWPPSLVKLSLLKNFGVHAYYSRTLELSPRFYDVYIELLEQYPVIVTLAVATACIWSVRRSKLPAALLPFVIYPLGFVVLQLGNVNLKPPYFVSLLPPLAVLLATATVHALSERHRQTWGFSLALVALGAAALSADAVMAARQKGTPAAIEALIPRLSDIPALASQPVLTWPPGSHAAQPLSFYLPETNFLRVIDEPDEVRRYSAALRRGVFPYVILDGAQGQMRRRDAEAVQSAYVLLFEVTGLSRVTRTPSGDARGKGGYRRARASLVPARIGSQSPPIPWLLRDRLRLLDEGVSSMIKTSEGLDVLALIGVQSPPS